MYINVSTNQNLVECVLLVVVKACTQATSVCMFAERSMMHGCMSLTSSYPRKEGQLCFPTHINFVNCQHFDYSALKKTVVKMLAVDKN